MATSPLASLNTEETKTLSFQAGMNSAPSGVPLITGAITRSLSYTVDLANSYTPVITVSNSAAMNSTSPSSTSQNSSAPSSGPQINHIIIGVLAALGGVAVLAILVLILIRRRKPRKRLTKPQRHVLDASTRAAAAVDSHDRKDIEQFADVPASNRVPSKKDYAALCRLLDTALESDKSSTEGRSSDTASTAAASVESAYAVDIYVPQIVSYDPLPPRIPRSLRPYVAQAHFPPPPSAPDRENRGRRSRSQSRSRSVVRNRGGQEDGEVDLSEGIVAVGDDRYVGAAGIVVGAPPRDEPSMLSYMQ